MGLQRKQEWQNAWSTIVLILSKSHQDPSATETFYFPLWCNSCCGDARIVYRFCLQYDNVVAKDSGAVTTNISCPVYVNKRQDTRCMLDTWWGYSCRQWVHMVMGGSKHIIWIIYGFKTVNNGKQLGWRWGSLEWPRDLDKLILYGKKNYYYKFVLNKIYSDLNKKALY